MVIECLGHKSTWTLATMRKTSQSSKVRGCSSERSPPWTADAAGLDEDGRIRKTHAKTGCVYARNPGYHLRKTKVFQRCWSAMLFGCTRVRAPFNPIE